MVAHLGVGRVAGVVVLNIKIKDDLLNEFGIIQLSFNDEVVKILKHYVTVRIELLMSVIPCRSCTFHSWSRR